MNIPITGSYWLDLIIFSLIFVIINKTVQHLFSDPKEYFFVKRRNKEIQAEMKELMKNNDYIGVQEKQKEAFSLMSRQFKGMFKTMIPLMLIGLPAVYFINKFYGPIKFIDAKFPKPWDLHGFWTYIFVVFILSIIVNNIYDKLFEKKYADYVPADYKKK
ncbi:MAG TPA: EMC3/TMCO1 family protein [archaeon]|jgi:uncharacterized membrane protein (DUF106 family)|nr:EMC3/TMCO1 family protein [archaeon]HPV66422.1 EMC3/TMCO1 family protein [archaeon]